MYIDGKPASVKGSAGSQTTTLNIGTANPVYIGVYWVLTTEEAYNGSMDEVRFSNLQRSPDWVRAEYLSESNQYLTYSNEELFGSELLSSIFDAGKGTSWGYLSYTASELEKARARVKVRTGNNRYLTDAPDFETCDSIINQADISSNPCVTDGDRYIQYQIILDSTETNKTPIFKDISLTDYLPSQIKPVTTGISPAISP